MKSLVENYKVTAWAWLLPMPTPLEPNRFGKVEHRKILLQTTPVITADQSGRYRISLVKRNGKFTHSISVRKSESKPLPLWPELQLDFRPPLEYAEEQAQKELEASKWLQVERGLSMDQAVTWLSARFADGMEALAAVMQLHTQTAIWANGKSAGQPVMAKKLA